MIKVLQCVDSMEAGGIQSFLMNVYRNIDREIVQFDFLVHNKNIGFYENEISKLGGNVFYTPPRHDGFIKNARELDKFFEQHRGEYAAAHLHESSLSYIQPLVAAKKYGIKIRIMHSHNSSIAGNKIHLLLHDYNSKRIDKIANRYLACGEKAGEWMYGKSKVKDNFEIIYNGIDIEKFAFNQNVRNKVRKELELEDKLVLGHVGRFMPVKNHKFLIDILKEVLTFRPDAVLMLVGNGELFDEIQLYAQRLGVYEQIMFLGVRDDVHELVQAMDVMVMPSLYEGFPVTAVEAEASGLPLYISDTITREVVIKDNVHVVSLEESAEEWAKSIPSDLERKVDNKCLYEKGFSIADVANRMQRIYLGED